MQSGKQARGGSREAVSHLASGNGWFAVAWARGLSAFCASHSPLSGRLACLAALLARDSAATGVTAAQVIKLDHDFGTTFSGVLTDEAGRMVALWASYAEQVIRLSACLSVCRCARVAGLHVWQLNAPAGTHPPPS
jgi:hypothetical protein